MRLIDADELLRKAEYISTGYKSRGMRVCFHGVTATTIENATTIDPGSLRPHGQWIKKTGSFDYSCTNCDETFPGWVHFFGYCPNCGAKMEKKSDET